MAEKRKTYNEGYLAGFNRSQQVAIENVATWLITTLHFSDALATQLATEIVTKI